MERKTPTMHNSNSHKIFKIVERIKKAQNSTLHLKFENDKANQSYNDGQKYDIKSLRWRHLTFTVRHMTRPSRPVNLCGAKQKQTDEITFIKFNR